MNKQDQLMAYLAAKLREWGHSERSVEWDIEYIRMGILDANVSDDACNIMTSDEYIKLKNKI